MMREAGILTALLCFPLLLGSISATPPDRTNMRTGVINTAGEGFEEAIAPNSESSEPERLGEDPCHQQELGHPSPPSFYRFLSRRSVGRYILATSSLVGECARIYTPAPLNLAASSLLTRFRFGMSPQGKNDGFVGQMKSSGLSYERFMSRGDRRDDSEGEEDFHISMEGDPPEKYGRVSPAFLLRHEIGDTGGLENWGEELVSTESEQLELFPVAEERPDGKREEDVMETTPRQPRHNTRGSIFKSIATLQGDRKKRAVDDIDLLSESEDEWDEYGVEERGEKRSLDELTGPLVRDDMAASTRKGSGTARTESSTGRNLVDAADETATSLVDKLRLGIKKQGSSSDRGSSSPRRSRR